MAELKKNSYIHITSDMVTKLKLSGTNLLVYAVIHGYTKDGCTNKYTGGVDLLCKWTNASRSTVLATLKYLTTLGYIIKEEYYINNVKFCNYVHNDKILTSGIESKPDDLKYKKVVANQDGGGSESTPNIIEDNIEDNNKKKDISNDISKKENSSLVESDSTSSDSNVKDSFTPLIPPDGSDDKPKRGRKAKPQSFDARADLSYVDDKFTKLWLFWLDYKDEIKKPYKTLVGAKSSFTRLRNGSNNNVTLAHAMVMTAIEKSYDGFFALSEKQESFFLSSKSPYCNDVKEFLTEDDNADSAPQPQSSVDSKWQG